MNRFFVWLHTLRSIVLAFRVIAFERFGMVVLTIWAALSLLIVLPVAVVDPSAAAVVAAAAALLYPLVRKAADTRRHRLIRIGDRIEYARTDDDEDYRQRFAVGAVLRYLDAEEVRRTGMYDPLRMEDARHFYLVGSADATDVVTFDQVVGIEIDGPEDDKKGSI